MRFSGALCNPLFCLFPSFIESKKAGLTPTLDQLIGFRDKFSGMDPGGKLDIWGDCASGGIPRDLSDFWRRVNEVRGDGGRRMGWGSALKPKGKEKLCVVFADRWIRKRLEEAKMRGEGTQTLCRHSRERWGEREKGIRR